MGPTAFGQLIIAHRGASHDAPENTLSAFQLAIEQEADGFEADFYLTSDKQIVCFHDKDTERICGSKLLVAKSSLEALRSLDVGRWKGARWTGARMPTLEEVLTEVPVDKKVFIELKTGAEIVEPLAKLLESASLPHKQMVIISFDADAVAACKKRLPHVKALWLCRFKKKKNEPPPPTVEEVAATLRRIQADGFNGEAAPDYFDATFIRRLRELGYPEFSVWTVDDPKVARFYQKQGAWAITTNRPGWLREQLESTQGE